MSRFLAGFLALNQILWILFRSLGDVALNLLGRGKLVLHFAGGFSLWSIPLHAIAGFKLFSHNEHACAMRRRVLASAGIA
jgi:hypothetical protein